ncbi:MAG: DNA-binding protein HU [Candidatus Asgardarchaeum californiense]|nr:MAG: DNA-binding protein HU [Candidatus Asgardarchaeum californiense]
MKQKEFIEVVAQDCDMSKSRVKLVLLTMLDTITETLLEGESVQFPGFGTFTTVERAAREGRNPATGEAMTFPASTGVKFKVGAALKRTIKEG